MTGEAEHQPYVSASQELTELTPGAIVLGVLLGLVFAASSVYLALRIGLTVSASIPIAVLSITIFRYVSRAFGAKPATILQNNMVQTTGSAGESIAAGTVFTLPALLLLGYSLPWTKVAAIALVGGLLGVLLMIPLRKSLIVKEHKTLKYPEGTACADVLIVGEQHGVQAKMVFMGFGLAVLYKFLNSGMHLWADTPRKVFDRLLPSGRRELFGEIRAEISPELTGVGYIVGPKIAGYLFAGGVLSFFVLAPAIKFFGAAIPTPIAPATTLIADMDAMDIRANYIYYIGAGAVTTAGIISLLRSLPTIAQALIGGLGGFKSTGETSTSTSNLRTQRDLPMAIVLIGTVVLAICMIVFPQIHINVVGALLAILFAFLFVTVSSRITGQIGASSNPISGMTVATVLLTALIFLAVGWTGIEHRVLALSIGGVVCIAAAVAGATSQDLKTGFLVGATPARQQIGLVFGVVTSALLIGGMIEFLNNAATTIVVRDFPGVAVKDIEPHRVALKDGHLVNANASTVGPTFRVGHLYEQTGAASAGRYLIDDAGAIKYLVDPGIGGREETNYNGKKITKLDSPKSQIMALVVDGILTQKLSWGLLLIGAFLAIAMELVGIPSLPVAVGVYLPISTSATMFMGGIVRWLVERAGRHATVDPSDPASIADSESGPGVLFSSGMIAGGAITGVLLATLTVFGWDTAFNFAGKLGGFDENSVAAMILYVILLCVPLYMIGKRKSS